MALYRDLTRRTRKGRDARHHASRRRRRSIGTRRPMNQGFMTSLPKLYLAGPDVFLADALAVGARKVALCAARGLEGLFPLDAEMVEREASARVIYQANMDLLRGSDGVIANLTPFRGISADVGTVYEVAYALALGKPVFAYTEAASEPRPAHPRRVRVGHGPRARGRRHDRRGFRPARQPDDRGRAGGPGLANGRRRAGRGGVRSLLDLPAPGRRPLQGRCARLSLDRTVGGARHWRTRISPSCATLATSVPPRS